MKLEELKSMYDYMDNKTVKSENKKVHFSNHKYVFQNLWSKYNKNEFLKFRLKNYIKKIFFKLIIYVH